VAAQNALRCAAGYVYTVQGVLQQRG
jgi:hypothetical protein